MPHPLNHKYPIPISQLCLVNTDVPAGVGAPPLDTTSPVNWGPRWKMGTSAAWFSREYSVNKSRPKYIEPVLLKWKKSVAISFPTSLDWRTFQNKKVFLPKISTCRDGTKPDRNNITTRPHHPYILCRFANWATRLLVWSSCRFSYHKQWTCNTWEQA